MYICIFMYTHTHTHTHTYIHTHIHTHTHTHTYIHTHIHTHKHMQEVGPFNRLKSIEVDASFVSSLLWCVHVVHPSLLVCRECVSLLCVCVCVCVPLMTTRPNAMQQVPQFCDLCQPAPRCVLVPPLVLTSLASSHPASCTHVCMNAFVRVCLLCVPVVCDV